MIVFFHSCEFAMKTRELSVVEAMETPRIILATHVVHKICFPDLGACPRRILLCNPEFS